MNYNRSHDEWDRQRRSDQRGAAIAVVVLLAVITGLAWAALRLVTLW